MIKNIIQKFNTPSNRSLFANAGSMIGSTAVTAGLGFAYWLLAAREFSQQVVGLASAAISAMSLLATFGVLGLGTLVIGEMGRNRTNRRALITTSLIVAALASAAVALVFGLIVPVLSKEYVALFPSPAALIMFAVGAAVTSVAQVLDGVAIGMFYGSVQFWRNSVFAVVKLVILLALNVILPKVTSLDIYNTWTAGTALSIVVVALALAKRGHRLHLVRPDWATLRELPKAALGHHFLNIGLQTAGFGLPIVVTALLSAAMNASFYTAWIIVSLEVAVPYTLTVLLFALGRADHNQLGEKMRLTISAALVVSLVANFVIWIGADFIMNIFGKAYAEQAAWALRVLSLGIFPLIIKDHWISVRRSLDKTWETALFVIGLGALELGLAAVGGSLGGLYGLAIGWLCALCIEAIVLMPAVLTAANLWPTFLRRERHAL